MKIKYSTLLIGVFAFTFTGLGQTNIPTNSDAAERDAAAKIEEKLRQGAPLTPQEEAGAAKMAEKLRQDVAKQKASLPNLEWKDADLKKLISDLLSLEAKAFKGTIAADDSNLAAIKAFFKSNANTNEKAALASKIPLDSTTLPVVLDVVQRLDSDQVRQRVILTLGSRVKKKPLDANSKDKLVGYLTELMEKYPKNEPIFNAAMQSMLWVDEPAASNAVVKAVLAEGVTPSPVVTSAIRYLQKWHPTAYESIISSVKSQQPNSFNQLDPKLK